MPACNRINCFKLLLSSRNFNLSPCSQRPRIRFYRASPRSVRPLSRAHGARGRAGPVQTAWFDKHLRTAWSKPGGNSGLHRLVNHAESRVNRANHWVKAKNRLFCARKPPLGGHGPGRAGQPASGAGGGPRLPSLPRHRRPKSDPPAGKFGGKPLTAPESARDTRYPGAQPGPFSA